MTNGIDDRRPMTEKLPGISSGRGLFPFTRRLLLPKLSTEADVRPERPDLGLIWPGAILTEAFGSPGRHVFMR
jgi:hypothetical protein